MRLLANFSGNQDDNVPSRRVAEARIAAGADVIFTALNAGRDGVTQACSDRGCRQIGNVIDRIERDPQVFIGSAVASVGQGAFEAVRDLQAGRFPAGQVRKLALAPGDAVKLTMAPDVPAQVLCARGTDGAGHRAGAPQGAGAVRRGRVSDAGVKLLRQRP